MEVLDRTIIEVLGGERDPTSICAEYHKEPRRRVVFNIVIDSARRQ
jgi:hypothetical protein